MKLLKSIVILVALSATSTVVADMEFYSGIGIGRSDADVNTSKIQSGLMTKGYDIQSVTVDSTDSGKRIMGGLRFNKNWSVELGYVDLGETEINVVGNISPALNSQFTQDVANAVPVMPRGITLAGVASVTLAQLGSQMEMADQFSLRFKLGMIDADSERDVNGARGADTVDASPYYGVTFGWDFSDSLRGVVGYEIFNLADSTDYWSAGVEYKFKGASR